MSLPLPYFGADTAKNTPHTAKKGILSPDPQLMKIETKVRLEPADYTGLDSFPRPMVARLRKVRCPVPVTGTAALEQDAAKGTANPHQDAQELTS